MPRLYLTTRRGIVVASGADGSWEGRVELAGQDCRCVAVDPFAPERVYCGTAGDGLWRSEDAGATWQQAAGLPHQSVTALAISRRERELDACAIYAGTAPSGLFRSGNGGLTWEERPALREVPSAERWGEPGEPGGSVRWLEADPMIPGRMYAAIAGAGVLRTHDYGLAWDDRHRSAIDDPHTLACHQFAPGRIYAAGADGYAESRDGGDTWRRDDVGLKHPYLFGLAIDPGDPETLIVSAARSRRRAHAPLIAAATIYRKSGKPAWREAREGLPGPAAQRIYGLAANEHEPGVFYLATQRGELYRSPDAGLSWRKQELRLAARLRLGGGQPPALALSGE